LNLCTLSYINIDIFVYVGSHDESFNEANILCERQVYLGTFIADASPYLYPFLIEYSLIGAAVLYVVWAHIGVDAHNK